MPLGLNEPSTDHQALKIETQRVLEQNQDHYAVIDIGSNSIRLVVYDALTRAPFPRFNEKAMVALGAGIDADGFLSEEVMSRALHSIRRFSAISNAMQVGQLDVLATEATRRAKNGQQLIEAIREETGLETRILTGEEEAQYAAYGIVAGFFQPKGMIGDMGGGSLEVAEVINDALGGRLTSMPLGALPVTEQLTQDYAKAKKWVDNILSTSLPPLLTNPVFFAVGGGWRALARVHIALNERPIGVVHGYEVPAEELRILARDISRMSPEQVEALPDIPSRRIATLPASALVLSRVLRQLKPEQVVFSSCGVREGWLYKQLDQLEMHRDPLLEGAMSIGLPPARVPAFSEALARWTDELFPGETQNDRRLRLAVCALTDLAWRDHDKVRATDSFLRLLQFPFIGLTHPERVFVSVAVFSRHGGRIEDIASTKACNMLTANELRRAEILGRALLLGHRFSASVPGILQDARLKIDADAVRLEILNSQSVPDSEAVQNRMRKLAKAIGVEDIEIVLAHQ